MPIDRRCCEFPKVEELKTLEDANKAKTKPAVNTNSITAVSKNCFDLAGE